MFGEVIIGAAFTANLSDTFHLRKWYFDCVSPGGDAAILYLARLRWRSAALHFSSLLLSRNSKVTTRTSIRRLKTFDDTRAHLDLALPGLHVRASFKAEQSSVTRTILPGIEWSCLQPKSQATIEVDDFTLEGLGYVERLEMSTPPWKLSIGELHWGRFLSASDSLIWIRTHGPSPTTIAMHNGHDEKIAHIGAHNVCLDSGLTLELNPRHTLRNGRLSDTVLPAAPILERFFPHSILNIRETKWCSQGRLTTKQQSSTGWAIHEVVEWPV